MYITNGCPLTSSFHPLVKPLDDDLKKRQRFKQGIAIQSCDKQPGSNEAQSMKHSTVRPVSLVESAARLRPLWREAKNLPRLATSNNNSPSDTQVKCTARCLR